MYIFQQDGATSRTSKVSQEHLDEEVPEFIKKNEWPPQSPDCNPVHVGLTLREGLSGPLKQRITELNAGNKYILLNLESPLDRGKGDFGQFVEKTEDQSIIFSPRLSYML
jgi:hypothetical protein